tara:strand:- start:1407 stop:2408 length:1002 start_codon:yes stop_codon:yes gene_type:complete
MKQIAKIIEVNISKFGILLLLISLGFMASCEDNTLPEEGSIVDVTPPEASFAATQGAGLGDAWKTYSFSNQSVSATGYAWDFGDGNTSTEAEPSHTYAGEGTFTVTLTATDNLNVQSVFTLVIEVVMPPVPVVPDPVLINADFNKLEKDNGNSSDCTCSGWDNDDIGEQGESSGGNGGSDNLVKFDNAEPDHIYQEFAVTANADYTIEVVVAFKSLVSGGAMPSMLELRVLAGSGYRTGYTPTYYATATEYPKRDFGYNTIALVETAANNLLTEVISNPSDTAYITYTYTFNAGNNSSAALFVRGIGGASTGSYGYNSGDEEIRMDSVTITAN